LGKTEKLIEKYQNNLKIKVQKETIEKGYVEQLWKLFNDKRY